MRKQAFLGGKRRTRGAAGSGRALGYEFLESRQMLSVSLGTLNNVSLPVGNSVLVPLTGVDSAGNPITYEFVSSDPNVTMSLVSPTSKSLKLNVAGTDKNGDAFTGTLIIHLFEDLAPGTTARIEQLVTQGFYDDAPFTRIIDGFMAQGGDTAGTGQLLDDEFNTSLRFVSPGLFATANRGSDTADSQFFITAINEANSSSPIALSHMPQHLNFRHTIFGQLVSGFETFQKIITTPVEERPNSNPIEISQPIDDVTIVSATLVTDTQNAVLKVTAPASFVGGSATITVTAKNAANETDVEEFAVGAVADTTTEPPFLGAVTNQTATAGTPITFTLTSTDASAGGVVYKVASASNFSTPANVTVSINQTTGVVTLTPAASFTGTISLLAGVRASSATDVQANFDTEAFTLTVTASGTTPAAPTGLGVTAASNTGPFDGNGYVSTATPTLTVTAVTGATVKFKIGGTEVATGVETASGSGVYTAAIPAGKLAVGANAVTAIVTTTGGTSTDSTALSLIFAPDYSAGVYVVPGAAGAAQSLVMQWVARNAAYANEIGFFVADTASGAVGGIAPGAAGYAKAALSSTTRQVVFAQGQGAGASKTVSLNGGQTIVFYLIQNNTTANFLAKNPTDSLKGNNNSNSPLAFFSVVAANPDNMRHTQIVADQTTGRVQYNWEDLVTLGDSDFNDVVMRVSLAAASTTPSGTLHAPGTGDKTTKLDATLGSGTNQATLGDVGVFFVDSPNGAIGSLTPGATGYAAAALASGNTRVLFTSGKTAGATAQVTVPAGKYLGFYVLSSGTTANFLTANPTNSSTGSTVAMFSFDAANANSTNHFRWYSPGSQATDPSLMQLHIMDQVFGDESAFDDLTLNLKFTA